MEMDKEELKRKIYSKIDEIPTLPTVLLKLLASLEDRRSNAADIAELISKDPALTSKILKVANSAYYGFPGEITSLERAVALLGFNMVRSLALSMTVINTISSGKRYKCFSEEDLWVHSITVATVMQEIVDRMDFAPEDSEHIFIIGLLHDIGKIVFDQFFSDLFEKVIEECSANGFKLYMAEQRVFGMDHGEVGGIILKRWKFPRVIYIPIAIHHKSDIPREADQVTASLLKLADSLVLNTVSSSDENWQEQHQGELQLLGIGSEVIKDVSEHIADSQERIKAFFSAVN